MLRRQSMNTQFVNTSSSLHRATDTQHHTTTRILFHDIIRAHSFPQTAEIHQSCGICPCHGISMLPWNYVEFDQQTVITARLVQICLHFWSWSAACFAQNTCRFSVNSNYFKCSVWLTDIFLDLAAKTCLMTSSHLLARRINQATKTASSSEGLHRPAVASANIERSFLKHASVTVTSVRSDEWYNATSITVISDSQLLNYTVTNIKITN